MWPRVAAPECRMLMRVKMGKQWYVVHTYSGYEQKAKKALEERIRQHQMEQLFGEILVPAEDVVEVKKGTKRTSKRQFFPDTSL